MEPTGRGFFGPFDFDPPEEQQKNLGSLSLARLCLKDDKNGVLDWLDRAFWSDERYTPDSLSLIISIFRGRFDIADILAGHGARLSAEETAIVQTYSHCEKTRLKAFLQHHHFESKSSSEDKIADAEQRLQHDLQKVFNAFARDNYSLDQALYASGLPPKLLQISKPSAQDVARFLKRHTQEMHTDLAAVIDKDRFLLRQGYFDTVNFTSSALQKLADDYAREPKAADLKRHFNLCACALRVHQHGISAELRPQNIDALMDAVSEGRFLPDAVQTLQICNYLYRLYMFQALPQIRDHVQVWIHRLRQTGAPTYLVNPMSYLNGDDFSFAHVLLEKNLVSAFQFDIAILLASPVAEKTETNARLVLQLILEKAMPERYAGLRGMPDSFYTAAMLKEYISNPDFVSQLALIKMMPPRKARGPSAPPAPQ
jgi:hypothetical protein